MNSIREQSEKQVSFDSLSKDISTDVLIVGGGGHRTGKRGGCWAELEAFAKKHYKNAETVAKWAAQDCMTPDDVPYIGQYAKSTPNVFCGNRLQQVGHDKRHGGGRNTLRPYMRQR